MWFLLTGFWFTWMFLFFPRWIYSGKVQPKGFKQQNHTLCHQSVTGSEFRQLGVSGHRCQWKLCSAPKVAPTISGVCCGTLCVPPPWAKESMLGLKPCRDEHSYDSNCHLFCWIVKKFSSPQGGEIQRASSRLDWGTVLKGLWGLTEKHNGVYSKWQLAIWRSEIMRAEGRDWCFMYMLLQLEVTLALCWWQHFFFTSLRAQWRGCSQAVKATRATLLQKSSERRWRAHSTFFVIHCLNLY